MLPLYQDPHFTFRFVGDRLVPRFHLEGVPPGLGVGVYRLDPATGERLGLLANATSVEGGWVSLPLPLVVRAGQGFVAVPGAASARLPNSPHPPRHVVFDLDGTLLDSRPGIVAALRHAVERLGHEPPRSESLDWAIGPPAAEVMARLLAPFGDARVEEGVALYRGWYGASGLYDARVYPGIPELLGRLRAAGKRLFVATAKREDFARTVLDHFGLSLYFAAAYGPGLDGRHSRKADLVAHLLAAEGLDPAEAVLVGDRGLDVEAARANGLRAVGAAWGYGGRDELLDADLLCDGPEELLGLAAA